ncbi:hypothetical protein INT44_009152 [Umbelopsis vinacea]|uniref:Yeast cell wall synthesis Kre9/Knh1-like N-terminal domain-containing protein n=1 Tax=Umbelopsis vinacea TaxID=44442 RepID=A0A8H7Q125_9FUNG|nr:hypothetical protein INT44_009152 [Umbelopsis vinacea]
MFTTNPVPSASDCNAFKVKLTLSLPRKVSPSFTCIVFLAIASVISADFAFTSPKENAVYHPGDKIKFAWHDYSTKNKTITLVLANQGKAHHWHPYKTLAHLRRPFPTSYIWHVPEDFNPDRYFLRLFGHQIFSGYHRLFSQSAI